MAIDKVEGVFGDMIVIYYQGNWYGIPKSQLVQIGVVQNRYGLVVTAENLVDNDIVPYSPYIVPTEEQSLADRVVLIGQRWERMGNEAVADLKYLIGLHPADFTGVLASAIIP
jgi:hypothetical protein